MEGEARARATVSLYGTGKRIKGREGIRSQPSKRERERDASYSTGSCESVRIVSTIPWIYDGHRANPFVSSASAQHANAAFFLHPPLPHRVRSGRCSTVPFHQARPPRLRWTVPLRAKEHREEPCTFLQPRSISF